MSGAAACQDIQVVIVDDNPDHLELLSLALQEPAGSEQARFCASQYGDPSEALADLPAEGKVVILCDYRMPGGTGLEWLSDFKQANVGPVLIMTGSGDEQIAAEAFRNGASDYLDKATIFEQPEHLRRAIREALRRYRLERKNRELARDLKRANSALERKNTELAELTDTAHRFVDNVAHEFRTPLSVIKEFASIIADGLGGPVTDKQTEYLQFIVDASRDLAMLVDDFLDSGKLRARALRVDRQPHDVVELFEAVRPMLLLRAQGKGLRLTEQLDAGLPQVLADVEKVGRVIVNLTINAIKFSPPDSEIVLWARPSDRGGVEIGVTDRGPGLPAEEVKVIFDRFRQMGDVQRTSTKGFGLGLNIARELVWLNLGEVRVESEPGRGSTFSFTLPPSDLHVALTWYLLQIEHWIPDGHVAALRVMPDPGQSHAELREFLCSVCYPMDFVLPDVGGDSLMLIGATAEPEKWADRLLRTELEWRKHQPDAGHEPIDVRVLGAWPTAQARHPVFSCVFDSRELRHCA